MTSKTFSVSHLIFTGPSGAFWVNGIHDGSSWIWADTGHIINSNLWAQDQPSANFGCVQMQGFFEEYRFDDSSCHSTENSALCQVD